jgi:hypothetical protein
METHKSLGPEAFVYKESFDDRMPSAKLPPSHHTSGKFLSTQGFSNKPALRQLL